MQRTDSCVIVFAKAPRPGTTKTRLIPLLGADGAAALHARLLEHTLATAKAADVGPVELHGTPAGDAHLRSCAERYGVTLLDQCGGDLGERMHFAIRAALDRSASVLLVGSDCPALTAGHLRCAAGALADGEDAVIVPTEDGGYALIGLTRAEHNLFSDMAWSTPTVLAETRVRLRDLVWRWRELETLWDVDRPDDYSRFMQSGLAACKPLNGA